MLSYATILFLAGATQGIILALAISLRGKLKQLSRVFLVSFILVITIQILLKVIAKDWVLNYFSYLGILAYQIPFLFGPVSFLYIRAIVDKEYSFRLRDCIHFVPFLIAGGLVTAFVLGVTSVQYVLPNNWARGILYMSLQLLTSGYYLVSSLRLIAEAEQHGQSSFSDPEKISIHWLRSFTIGSALTGAITTIVLCLLYNLYPASQEIRYLLLAQGVFIYWVTYKAITVPVILELPLFTQTVPLSAPVEKYINNPISEEKAQSILALLVNKMESEKLFLDAELGIEKLSVIVGQSKHDISRVINERMGINFFDFVNNYRVDAAKHLLADPAMSRFTIAAVAFECGFNSVSAFNAVFKKFEGVTPSAYRKRSAAAS